METSKSVKIVTYDPKFKVAFKDLNLHWIQNYFEVEGKDRQQLENPEECLQAGGEIFFVLIDEQAVGTCALYFVEPGVYELAKMAVDPEFQGQGLSRRLMEATEAWAQQAGAHMLKLYSNTRLTPAIALYRAYGYKEVIMGPTDYDRCDIAMEKAITGPSKA